MQTAEEDGGWIGFVNREAEALVPLLETLPIATLRGHLRDRLLERFSFPLQTVVRALVVGEMCLEHIQLASGDDVIVTRESHFLEIVPSGISREAAALTGPLLIPCARRLGPGSVLTVAVAIDDPTRHRLPGPGLLAHTLDYSVEVAVEA